ncbi:MAG: hypothetical protein UR66_C0024G0004 [Candidatus Moranbacteria bacterium GW2011_GWE1_35_17]|nr:MAG: hypothetical protein UR66_C0024G0004 [Candidatus Moranbacteria bacterium GW2011_GWE1_35_17]
MKNARRASAISLIIIGIFLGFWGSIVFYISWLVSPLMGFAMMVCNDNMPERYIFFTYPKWINALFISAGIVLGGLFMWGVLAEIWITTVKKFSWIPIGQIFVTAILFFLGAVAQILYCKFQERKSTSRIG